MDLELYKGSHQALFEAFLILVDDFEAQTAALQELIPWEAVRSLLSIGGGKGLVEASLLQNAPQAKVWYLDPSPEQCENFRQYMEQQNLLDRVKNVAPKTFQEYHAQEKFDRILSIFSWYFMGAQVSRLNKLLGLLNPKGVASIVLPNTESIFADFTRNFSPDKRMTLVGEDVMNVLDTLKCDVIQHTHTKWLKTHDLFDGELASEASMALAAFVAMRPISALTPAEQHLIVDLLQAKRAAKGVPLSWDLLVINNGDTEL